MNFQVPPHMQQMMQQMMNDPVSFGKEKGFNLPENLVNDPQAMVMHLIQTGQVSAPAMQRVMPMIQKMNGK